MKTSFVEKIRAQIHPTYGPE